MIYAIRPRLYETSYVPFHSWSDQIDSLKIYTVMQKTTITELNIVTNWAYLLPVVAESFEHTIPVCDRRTDGQKTYVNVAATVKLGR